MLITYQCTNYVWTKLAYIVSLKIKCQKKKSKKIPYKKLHLACYFEKEKFISFLIYYYKFHSHSWSFLTWGAFSFSFLLANIRFSTSEITLPQKFSLLKYHYLLQKKRDNWSWDLNGTLRCKPKQEQDLELGKTFRAFYI